MAAGRSQSLSRATASRRKSAARSLGTSAGAAAGMRATAAARAAGVPWRCSAQATAALCRTAGDTMGAGAGSWAQMQLGKEKTIRRDWAGDTTGPCGPSCRHVKVPRAALSGSTKRATAKATFQLEKVYEQRKCHLSNQLARYHTTPHHTTPTSCRSCGSSSVAAAPSSVANSRWLPSCNDCPSASASFMFHRHNFFGGEGGRGRVAPQPKTVGSPQENA